MGSSSYGDLIANFESISPDRAGFLMQIARIAKVPVIMDAGGAEGPIPEELLKFVTVLSPNETELARLTGMPTKSLEDVIDAAAKIQEMVSFWPFILHAESHFCLHSHGTESGQDRGMVCTTKVQMEVAFIFLCHANAIVSPSLFVRKRTIFVLLRRISATKVLVTVPPSSDIVDGVIA